MAAFGNLSGFGESFATGKLLNNAFKKEEIRRPVKHRHHQCQIQEWPSTNILHMHAPYLNTSVYVFVRRAGYAHWDQPADVTKDGMFNVQISFSRASKECGHLNTHVFNCRMHEIKGDRLPAYFDLAAVRFFDFVQSVNYVKDMDDSRLWCELIERAEQRNKWK